MNASLIKEFKNPGSEYRGKPFWAWNGKLEPEELRRQIRIMKKMGLGGFFMHSRVGLDTAYLSDEWFNCVNACLEEAKSQDMEAWLYDEDRWPSGAAGGLVTKNPAYRMRRIGVEVVGKMKPSQWSRDVIAVFKASVDGNKATDVRRVVKGKRTDGPGSSFIVFREVVAECSSWYNGQTYLDTMNHAAVREFIRVTHEKYRQKIGRHFGTLVPGIFTDEPNFWDGWDREGQKSFPWTTSLPATFKKRYGYDISDRLVDIFFDVDGNTVSRPRYHYMDCVTFLFVDAFSRQIGEWCGKNGIEFTGHVLSEELLSSQTAKVGSVMRFYEHMQAPGMDILTQGNREYDTAKCVASVARQFGRKHRLSETYGCTGWDFPFAGHKAVGDWQTALGINLRAHHLAWYTMEGEAKRDYPAAIFYQSPWWEHYRTVEDYYSRLHAVLGRGAEVRDVLVIHPVESTWLHVRRGWDKDEASYRGDRVLIALRDTLLSANIDFDYGEEEIMSRHAKVVSVKGTALLKVAKAAYSVVVVPPMTTIRSSTLRLLQSFAAKGGIVVFAGDPAGYVDALPSKDVAFLAKSCIKTEAQGPELASAVALKGRRISISDGSGREIGPALHLLTQDKDAYYLFVCNTGHEFETPKEWSIGEVRHEKRTLEYPVVKITGFADCNGAPVELDALSGAVYGADAVKNTGSWVISTSLARLGSRLFMIPKIKTADTVKPRPVLKDLRVLTLADKEWKVRLSEPNVLVLDRPAFHIGSGPQQPAEEVLRVDNKVRGALGLEHRGGAMVQPWMRTKVKNPKSVTVSLEYAFSVDTVPAGAIMLALEQAERFSVTVNGSAVSTDTQSGWWVDRSLQTLRIDPALLAPGANVLRLVCSYDQNHPGLEIVYLLGDFGVRTDGMHNTLIAPVGVLALGDWTCQGLPFYSGSVSYAATIEPGVTAGERVFVKVPAYLAAAVRILVDGREAGVVGWEPSEVEITGFLGSGPVTLGIELLGSRRNSHGPLHLTDRTPGWTGPGEFKTSGEKWTDEYVIMPCGLMKEPLLVIRR